MEPLSNFEQWYSDNLDFLESNGVERFIAQIIWDSAKSSAMHDLVSMVHSGKLKVNLE